MKYAQVLDIGGDAPVFETGLLLAGDVDAHDDPAGVLRRDCAAFPLRDGEVLGLSKTRIFSVLSVSLLKKSKNPIFPHATYYYSAA